MVVRIGVIGFAVAAVSLAGVAPAAAQSDSGGGPAFSACPASEPAPARFETPCMAIVEFDAAVSPAQRANAIRRAGATVRFNYRILNSAAVMVPNQRTYRALVAHPDVVRVVPDRPVRAFHHRPGHGGGGGGGQPQLQPVQPGVARVVGDPQVWRAGPRGNGVVVAVLDTGIDAGHPDLEGQVVINDSATCLGDSKLAACTADGGLDDHGHGTHVAGIIAALDNGIDVVGVAPDAKLVSVKVLDRSGRGWDSNIIAGLDWLVGSNGAPNKADVVNMSLGRGGVCTKDDEALMRNAVQATVTAGITVVVAAGNDNSKDATQMVPAGCPGAIAVASTTAVDGTNSCKVLPGHIRADTYSYFTTDFNTNAELVFHPISAPGGERENNNCGTIQPVGILSLAMGSGTTRMSGTSMAAPHVGGVAALIISAASGCGGLAAAEIGNLLVSNADRQGAAPFGHPYISANGVPGIEGIAYAPAAVAEACPVS
jgi:subtilisin